MTSKIDSVLENVIKTREDIAGIKEHLKTLNGSVTRHENSIQKNEEGINFLNNKIAKLGGGIAVVIITIQVILHYI